MKQIKLKYRFGDKLVLNDETIVIVKAVHIYISAFTIGYQLYVTDIKTRKSQYIGEEQVLDFYEV